MDRLTGRSKPASRSKPLQPAFGGLGLEPSSLCAWDPWPQPVSTSGRLAQSPSLSRLYDPACTVRGKTVLWRAPLPDTRKPPAARKSEIAPNISDVNTRPRVYGVAP